MARTPHKPKFRLKNSNCTKEEVMAIALPTLDIPESGADLARKTVFIKLHLDLLGNTRKVSLSQVEVDADRAQILATKRLLASPELQAIRTLDGELRRYLYDTCLPFEVGIHLLPLGLLETEDEKLREFREKRSVLVEVFLDAYPRTCQEAVGRLRTLHKEDWFRAEPMLKNTLVAE
jgi:hypothetical protein